MGTGSTVRQATAADRDPLIAAFAAAALDEAVTVWILHGHPADRFLAGWVPDLIDKALCEDEIWIAEADGSIRAVSLWQTVTSVDRHAAEAAELRAAADAAPEVSALRRAAYVTSLLAREHPREFPHRYLQVIVTVPEHRGKGAGGAILTDRLKAASDASIPAFLEASTQRSARLYTRKGFVREGHTHTLPEDGPTLIPMWFRG
ncbi:GNAT family N-acetyltransferase [Nocardia sp. NPDC050408]|uniref:GNAT family N-acetyltransferase n=1 Tax=unclassified Nocardia TaxID=2637762 RepID=UPI0034240839